MDNVDLKEIRSRVYLSYFQDGLWDILLGLFPIFWGIGLLTDTAGLSGVWFVPAYWIIWALKKRITHPRIGQAKVPQTRKTSVRLLIAGTITFVIAIAAFMSIQLFDSANGLDGYFMFIFGAIIAIMASLIAYWWRVSRWYAYAALLLAGAASLQWLDTPLAWSFIVPGAIIVLSGVYMLIRFLRRYPIVTEEHTGENRQR
jgi:hypothetical protein